jgi:phage terminase Nu1 subunit (DNA packaging protein)
MTARQVANLLKEPMPNISRYAKRGTVIQGKYLVKLDLTEEEKVTRASWMKSHKPKEASDDILKEWDDFTDGVRKRYRLSK